MNASGLKVRYAIIAVVAFVGFWLFRVGTSSDLGAGAQFLAHLVGLALFVAAASPRCSRRWNESATEG